MFAHWPCFPEAQEMTSSARPADGPLQVDGRRSRSLTHAKWAARAEALTLAHTQNGVSPRLPPHNVPLYAAVTSVSFLQATLTAGNMSEAEEQRSFMAFLSRGGLSTSSSRRGA